LGELRWEARFDHLTLLRLERATGLDVLGGAFDLWNLDSRTLRTAAQVTAGTEVTLNWKSAGYRVLGQLISGLQQAWNRDMPVTAKSAATKSGSAGPIVTTWPEAWANARQILGLSDREWLSYTPRMVQLLSEYHLERIRQTEWMLAQVCSSVVNWSMSAPRSPIRPETFMLHPWDLPHTELPQTPESVLQMFRNFSGMDEAGKLAVDTLLSEPLLIN
jgi:hypothetical protein